MWIRSQDREQLKNCSNFEIDVFYNIEGNLDILGTYATLQRALEVLDEIQVAILSQTRLFIDESSSVDVMKEINSIVVYEMPKE